MKRLHVTSPAFSHKGFIPKKYAQIGKDIHPPLHISGIPESAKTITVIVDDPDVSDKVRVHWMTWNIPVSHEIKEGASLGIEGYNDFHKQGYEGPCETQQHHRYMFKVYALDQKLEIPSAATKRQLEDMMKHHVVACGELIGIY